MEVLVGYIIEVNNSPDEESVNGDEDGEFGFMDLDESHDVVKTRNAKLRFVNLQPIEGSKRQNVQRLRGIFPLTAPWLQVTVKCQLMQPSGSPYWKVTGCPSYCLRTDKKLPTDNVLEMMLTRWLKLDPGAVASFVAFIDRNPSLERARFMDAVVIKEAMRQYCSDWLSAAPTRAKQKPDDAWKYQIWCKTCHIPPDIEAATSYPTILSRLPLLLPKQVFGILNKSSCFEALHQMLLNRPWELAFFQITKKLLSLNLPEVPLERFRDADLLETFPNLYKQAVQIYAALNRYCNSGGHTYVQLDKLLSLANVRNAASAISYLVENDVIVVEKRPTCTNVYPWRLHMAEASLCEHIAELCLRSPPWTFHFNGSDESFCRIRKDRYQMKAATTISKKPVVVVNGRGGTGKTETMQSISSAAVNAIIAEQLKLEIQQQDDIVKRLVSERSSHLIRNGRKRGACSVPYRIMPNLHGVTMIRNMGHHADSPAHIRTLAGRSVPNCPAAGESSPPLATDSCDGRFGESNVCDQVPLTCKADMDPKAKSNLNEKRQVQAVAYSEWSFDDGSDEDIETYLSQTAEELEKRLNGPTTQIRPVLGDPVDSVGDSYILLVAPTGRAAKVLSKRTGWPAYTIHQVINQYEEWRRRQGSDNCPPRNTKSSQIIPSQFKFAYVRILVVDECSLVSVQIIARLLRILKAEAKDGIGLRRLILLGDVDQLPSVQPGNFFEDVSVALAKVNHCCVTLMNNHRSEGSLIFENAIRIATRSMPRFSEEHNFRLWPVRRITSVADMLGCTARKRVCRDEPQAASESTMHKLSTGLSEVIVNLLKEEEMQNHEKSQFIAFRRADCNLINDICCRHYTKHERYSKGRPLFSAGDKVCCRRNARVQLLGPSTLLHSTSSPRRFDIKYVEVDKDRGHGTRSTTRDIGTGRQSGRSGDDDGQPKSRDGNKGQSVATIRLCNGEVFFVTNIITRLDERGRSRSIMFLRDEDGEELELYTSEIVRECSLSHAWARTIHTFQGSEVDVVAYVLGATAGRQTWQHVYTAITRGRRYVHVVADEDELRQAVGRDKDKRFSSLKRRLVQRLCYPGVGTGEVPKSANPVAPGTAGHTVPEAFGRKAPETLKSGHSLSCELSSHDCATSQPAVAYDGTQTGVPSADSRQLRLPSGAPTVERSFPSGYRQQQNVDTVGIASHPVNCSLENSACTVQMLQADVAASDHMDDAQFESDCSTYADDLDDAEFESDWSSIGANDVLDPLDFDSD